MAGLLAGALVRSIRSESNRESQVEVEAGSGRLRPSPSRIPHRTPSLSILFSRIPFSPSLPFLSLPFPNERTNELCLAPSPLFSSLSRCRSLNRSSCSRLRNSRSLTVQQVIFFQLSPSARLPSPVFFCPSLPTSLFHQHSCFSLSVAYTRRRPINLPSRLPFVRCRLDDETNQAFFPLAFESFSRACAVRAPFQPRRSCGERGN